jgi:hypothetical protein
MQRVNESLIDRGYVTWFDLTNMKGGHAALSLSALPSVRVHYWTLTQATSADGMQHRQHNGCDE